VICYHGTPFGGSNSEAAEALIGRHALVSFMHQQQLKVAIDVCQSICLDNGAFSVWRSGKTVDWDSYFAWVEQFAHHPRVDFALIPDVIDGTEEENDALITRWEDWFDGDHHNFGVPVWHMNESFTRLNHLVKWYPRIAIGSSGEFSRVGSQEWYDKMDHAMLHICDSNGYPKTKLHMLRGLDPKVFTKYPFHSADSTNAGRNCNIESAWKGTYAPPSNSWRARVIMARTESYNSAEKFNLPEWITPPATDSVLPTVATVR